MQVKIFGERNTGTRYLSRLLEQNLAIGILAGAPPVWVRRLQRQLPGREWLRDAYFLFSARRNLGWKHSLPEPALLADRIGSRSILLTTLTKNPYAWLVSLYRRPYHQLWQERPSFSEFLTRPWRPIRREGVGKTVFASPVALWNEKNRAYLILAERAGALNLTYEALLTDPPRTVATIAAVAGVAWDMDGFKNLESSTKNSAKTHTDYQAYYAREQWREVYSPQDIETVNERLDPDVVRRYGYDLIG